MHFRDSCCIILLTAIITGDASALHCCKAQARVNRKTENSTPAKIENFNPNLSTRDCVGDGNHRANFGANPFGGDSSQPGEIWHRCDFFDCLVLFLDHAHRSYRWKLWIYLLLYVTAHLTPIDFCRRRRRQLGVGGAPATSRRTRR